jgi:hypothetical protein
MSGSPAYITRREKLTWGTLTVVVGVLAWQASHLLGRVLILAGLAMVGSGIVRGRERIR